MKPSPLLGRRTLLLVALSAVWLPVLSAPGAQATLSVEGQAFERNIVLAGEPLVLNGVGVRSVAWLKGFVAGLYLRAAAPTEAQVLAVAGPKRLRLRMLLDVPAAEFVKAVRKGVVRNAESPAAAAALNAPLAAFESAVGGLGKVRKGDVIDLDLDPARGTLIVVNGTLLGSPIAGEGFYRALLRSFVGAQPYDDKLRAGLLGPLS